MNIKLIEVNDNNFPSIVKLFDNKDFFFKTKRPESLLEGSIRELVFSKANLIFLLYYDYNLEGIISKEHDEVDENSILVTFRLNNMNLILNNIKEFEEVMLSFCGNYDFIKIKIYDFDYLGKEVCKELKFNVEAVLKNHIYKNNKFNDLIIYSKKCV